MQEHLSECRECSTRLQAMATLVAMVKRGSAHQAKKEEATGQPNAQVYVLGSNRFRTRGRILERSHDVLRLLLAQELVPETLAQIRTPEEVLLGEVRYCLRVSGNRFEIALRVQAITKLLPGSE